MPSQRLGSLIPRATPLFLGVAIFFWIGSVRSARATTMTAYGLISQLNWMFYFSLILVSFVAGVELAKVRPRRTVLTWTIITLVLILFGTSPATTQVGALTDSYIHTGFTSYILQHGSSLLNYDARFSWPGAFAFAGFQATASGVTSTLPFLKWFPLVIELAYLAPLLVIARHCGSSLRAGYLGVILFYTGNWIYQDYFSPQALNYLFFLTVVAVAMATWYPSESTAKNRLGKALQTWSLHRIRGDDSYSILHPRAEILLIAVLTLLMAASAVSHQLTPFAMVLALLALLGARRLARPEVLVIAMLLPITWLSIGAFNFWVGHLSLIFGSVGSIGATIGSNVGSRVVGSSSHLLVVKWRIYATAILFALAGLGVLRRASDDRSLELLSGSPFVLLLAQSYGGEGLLRATLYSLPFTSQLAASAVLPRRWGATRPWVALLKPRRLPGVRRLLGLCISVLIVGTGVLLIFVRGGNDYFETYNQSELDAVHFVDAHARHGAVVGVFSTYLPIGDASPLQYSIFSTDERSSSPSSALAVMRATHPNFVIVTRSQENWGEVVMGYPKGWEYADERALRRDGYRVVFKSASAEVLQRGNS